MERETKLGIAGGSVALVLVCAVVTVGMVGCPRYNVWRQAQEGLGELKHAESSRQIAIQEAHAKMESAKLLAEAEVARARGVAEANRIIGDSLKGNESYLRYLFIQALAEKEGEVIYVPTEANLPILEAGRSHNSLEKK